MTSKDIALYHDFIQLFYPRDLFKFSLYFYILILPFFRKYNIQSNSNSSIKFLKIFLKKSVETKLIIKISLSNKISKKHLNENLSFLKSNIKLIIDYISPKEIKKENVLKYIFK